MLGFVPVQRHPEEVRTDDRCGENDSRKGKTDQSEVEVVLYSIACIKMVAFVTSCTAGIDYNEMK